MLAIFFPYCQILTRNTENLTNATVVSMSVIPALPPPPPQLPVIPPLYQNITNEAGNTLEKKVDIAVDEVLNNNNLRSNEEVINCVIPSSIRVSMQPHAEVSIVCN